MVLTMAFPIWAICLLCFSAVSGENSTTVAPTNSTAVSNTTAAINPVSKESLEDSKMPPSIFPADKAVPFTPGKLPWPAAASEAADMMKDDSASPAPSNETDRVDHPNVKDPGTTHEEGTEGSSDSKIQACLLPPVAESEASASDWLRDGGNVTKLCSLPLDWLNSSSNGTIHICSIPKDVWEENYKGMTNGEIPKELLQGLNDTNVTCVTPNSDMADNSSAAKEPIANGSIPSAWLRDSKDNIYIYIIPREWLKGTEGEGGSSPAPSVAPAPTEVPSGGNATATSATTGKEVNVTVAPAVQNVTVTNPTPANTTATPNATVTADVTATAVSSNVTTAPTATPATNATQATPVASDAPANATTLAPAAIPSSSKGTAVPTAPPSSAETAKPTATSGKPSATTSTAPKAATTTTTESNKTTVTAVNPPASTQTPKTGTRPADAENEVEGVHPATPAALSQQHSSHEHTSNGKTTAFLQPTESAAILAGVFVAIALLGYAGLLIWRRVLERRYGNREMLVNEDDDFDTSDMRHFEL